MSVDEQNRIGTLLDDEEFKIVIERAFVWQIDPQRALNLIVKQWAIEIDRQKKGDKYSKILSERNRAEIKELKLRLEELECNAEEINGCC